MTATSMGDVLHERDGELAALARAVDAVVGGTGSVVVVEGSAGIGKTRLLDAVVEMAAGRARVLRARGGEQDREVPLLATGELFASYVAGADAGELDRVFRGAAALAGPLLGRGSAAPGTADPGFALTHGLYWLVANLAEESPVVLVVDDAHWVDESTQRWLSYLVPRVAELRVLLVLAIRPRVLRRASPLGLGIASNHDVTTIRPASLSSTAGSTLLRSRLPAADDAFCAAAHRVTGGNPLLLRSLAAAVREQGIEPTGANTDRLDPMGALELARLVVPRLHAAGVEAVGLARAIVVLGDGCALGDAADLARLPLEAAAGALDRLAAAEILVAGPSVSFAHPLVRSAVRDDVPVGERTLLHRRAARLLHDRGADPESVARHVGLGERVDEPWARDALVRAADAAVRRGVPEAAVSSLALLLREALPRDERRRTLVAAAWQAHRCGDDRGTAWLAEAITLANDSSSWIAVWLPLATSAARRLDHEIPPDFWLDTAPPQLDNQALYALRGYSLFDFGITGKELGPLIDKRFPRSLPVPAGTTLAERIWLTGASAREVMGLGDWHRAVEYARAAWNEGVTFTEAIEMPGTGFALITLVFTGALDEARAWADRALQEAVDLGSRAGVEVWAPTRVLFELFAGDVDSAEAHLAAIPSDPAHYSLRHYAISAAIAELEVLLARGRLDEADAFVARFVSGDFGSNQLSAYLLQSRARLHLASGRIEQALADFEECGRMASAFGGRSSPWYQWRGGVASCEAQLGRLDVARALAEEQLADFRRWGCVHAYGPALRTLGVVLGATHGLPLVEESVAELRPSPYRHEYRESLLALGRLLRRARRTADARTALAEVLELADGAGARAQADQAEEELRLTGARPRRRAVTGVHALTPAELRVVTLAARGLSNPEIAQSLFVTRKTIEKHLGAAFAKLHVSSREQLSAVLDRG